MSNKRPCWFMIDADLSARLEAMKARTGVSIAELIRRAIRHWLDAQEWPVSTRSAAKRTSFGE